MAERDRTPFGVHPLGDAIIRKASIAWSKRQLDQLVRSKEIGVARITTSDAPAIKKAFMGGAHFEIERLSRATGVDFRSIDEQTLNAGATVWFSHVRRVSNIDACSIPMWQRLLINSFEAGVDFVSNFLWPKQPRPRRKVTRR